MGRPAADPLVGAAAVGRQSGRRSGADICQPPKNRSRPAGPALGLLPLRRGTMVFLPGLRKRPVPYLTGASGEKNGWRVFPAQNVLMHRPFPRGPEAIFTNPHVVFLFACGYLRNHQRVVVADDLEIGQRLAVAGRSYQKLLPSLLNSESLAPWLAS